MIDFACLRQPIRRGALPPTPPGSIWAKKKEGVA